MSKKMATATPAPADGAKAVAEVFSFGDPVPVLNNRQIFDYLEMMHNGRYYEPPLSYDGLAQLYRAAVHHSSAIQVKRNILRSLYVVHPLLPLPVFTAWVNDLLIFGNSYMEQIKARSGRTLELRHAMARYTRSGLKEGQYFWLEDGKEVEFTNPVLQIAEADTNQMVYGIPDYVAAMNSTLLNESATLFRRKYYENGSHAGFILYLTDATQRQEDIDALRKALKDAKGPGNFRNLVLYAPGGKADGLKLVPVAEVAAKDDFFNIKNVTRDDQLAAHRVPPQLMGIVPSNTGGFGDAHKAAQVFEANEIAPLQAQLKQLNTWLGEEVVTFRPYKLAETPA